VLLKWFSAQAPEVPVWEYLAIRHHLAPAELLEKSSHRLPGYFFVAHETEKGLFRLFHGHDLICPILWASG